MTHKDIFNLREETEVHMKIMAGGDLTINSQGYMNRVRVSGGYAQVSHYGRTLYTVSYYYNI
jgi:hypothetical protein